MHELSVVMSILDIVREQAANAGADNVEEIEIDIGCLSSIEMTAFDFAWQQAVKDTGLQNAARKINRIVGRASCLDCNAVFNVAQLYDACPVCGQHLLHIIAGKELRVRSLVVV